VPNGYSGKAWGAISSHSCSPALIVLAIVLADAISYCDTDLWGHIRFGQAILATGHIIRADPYSYSAAGHIWIDHEWLSEVIMAASYNWLGVLGLRLLKLTLTVVTFVFLAKSLELVYKVLKDEDSRCRFSRAQGGRHGIRDGFTRP
jgi:hypothetical protein